MKTIYDLAVRVRNELKTAGMSAYGLSKVEARRLHLHIMPDEHIHGAIYGKIAEGWMALLVATDKRVIFYDKDFLTSTFDEIPYDVISGVKINHSGILASLTLHTKVREYLLKFVNLASAQKFASFIEHQRLSGWQPNVLKQRGILTLQN